ncbi:uncharacterized protein LOC117153716 isoform X4 [Bombus vancouverensis nearcticus]|uniref:uncharacterized protein LOC117153716 isoform X4 n=1 Tax=Bombus vancouverensis nearcticus TaxID=2705178 RepID=UPI00402BBC9B
MKLIPLLSWNEAGDSRDEIASSRILTLATRFCVYSVFSPCDQREITYLVFGALRCTKYFQFTHSFPQMQTQWPLARNVLESLSRGAISEELR